MRVIEHADVICVFHGEEFHEWKFARELAPHPGWNYFVFGAMKNRDPGGEIALRHVGEIRSVIVTLDQQTRDPAAEDAAGFFSKGCERGDQNNFLEAMIGREVERNRRA